MAITSRLRNTLIGPVAAFAAVGAMTIVSPVNAASASSSASTSVSAAGVASAASARARTRIDRKDRLRDVRSANADTYTGFKRVRKNKTADIVRTKASLGRKLVLTTTTRATLPKRRMGVVARVATGAGDFDYAVEYIRGFLGQGNSLRLLTPGYTPVPCSGLRVERKNAKHLIRVVLPARCIGSPGRVRVGVAAVIQKRGRLYIDDAFDRTSNGQDIALSRWLARR